MQETNTNQVHVVDSQGEIIKLQPLPEEGVVIEVQPPVQVVPQNGTEQIIVSAIELGFVLIVGILVGLYIKFKNHPWVAKLNIDPETLKGMLSEFMTTYKEQAKEEAIKKAREKDIKIPGVHDMTPEEIKAYEEKAKSALDKQPESTEQQEEKK